LAATADGAVWMTRIFDVVRFDASGRVTHLHPGGEAIAPAGPDSVWIAYDTPPRIALVGADGKTIRTLQGSTPRTASGLDALTTAADGSPWFLAAGYPSTYVGHGQTARWKLPEPSEEHDRIVAGPDGAMWVTGQHAIWRIDAVGQMTKVSLGDLIPHDLV